MADSTHGPNSQLTDSGYASLANSPDSKDTSNRDVSHESKPQSSQLPSRSFTSSILGGLKRFDKDVDQAAIDRFKDVVERVQGPLVYYLRKRYGAREIQPMAIRLIVLGETFEAAKPGIIVFCPEDKAKRVKKFFEQRLIKSICRPNDLSQASFEVTVIGQPPRPKNADSGIEVYGASTHAPLVGRTSSSTLIRLTQEDEERYATMGGIIKIVGADDDFVLCGLTARHVLKENDEQHKQDGQSPLKPDTDSELSMDEESDDDDEMLDADITTLSTDTKQVVFSRGVTEIIKTGTSWSRVGTIAADNRLGAARDRDWALIENIDRQLQQQNTLQTRSADSTQEPTKQLTLVKSKADAETSPHRALVLSSEALDGCDFRSGILSSLPSMALLPSGTSFVPVYTITLDEDSDLPDGSSGSWVIDERTCEVYGHVVADDPFGDIFVVPLTDVLNDIKCALGAKEVSLPSDIDIFSHLSRNVSQALSMGLNLVSERQTDPIEDKSPLDLFRRRAAETPISSFADPLPSTLPGRCSSPPPVISKTSSRVPPYTQLDLQWGLPTPENSPPDGTGDVFAEANSWSFHTLIGGSMLDASPPNMIFQSHGCDFTSAALSASISTPLPPRYEPKPLEPSLSPYKSSLLSNVNGPSENITVGRLSSIPGRVSVSQLESCLQSISGASLINTERSFKCDQCVRSFNRNHDLKRHKRIHLAVKPFPCGHCDKSFLRKDALKRHTLVKGCGKHSTEDKAAETIEDSEKYTETAVELKTPHRVRVEKFC